MTMSQLTRGVLLPLITAMLFLSIINSVVLANRTPHQKVYAIAISTGQDLVLNSPDQLSATVSLKGRHMFCGRLLNFAFASVGTNCTETPKYAAFAQRI